MLVLNFWKLKTKGLYCYHLIMAEVKGNIKPKTDVNKSTSTEYRKNIFTAQKRIDNVW